jgi:hypothetical protein
MCHRKFFLTLAGALLLCSSAVPTQAQTGVPTPQKYEPMTDDNLGSWVRKLGYKSEEKLNIQGDRFWLVPTQQDGVNCVVELAPYRINGRINGYWLIARVGDPINANQPPSAQALLKVLETNHTLAPYFFSFDKGSKQICLNFEHPNNTGNQTELSSQLNMLLGKVRSTKSVWSLKPGADIPIAPGTLVWTGNETLENFGPLTFHLAKDAKATVIDAQSTTAGSWSQKGNQITVTLPNSVYEGMVKDNTLRGTARASNGQTWTFQVKRQD